MPTQVALGDVSAALYIEHEFGGPLPFLQLFGDDFDILEAQGGGWLVRLIGDARLAAVEADVERDELAGEARGADMAVQPRAAPPSEPRGSRTQAAADDSEANFGAALSTAKEYLPSPPGPSQPPPLIWQPAPPPRSAPAEALSTRRRPTTGKAGERISADCAPSAAAREPAAGSAGASVEAAATDSGAASIDQEYGERDEVGQSEGPTRAQAHASVSEPTGQGRAERRAEEREEGQGDGTTGRSDGALIVDGSLLEMLEQELQAMEAAQQAKQAAKQEQQRKRQEEEEQRTGLGRSQPGENDAAVDDTLMGSNMGMDDLATDLAQLTVPQLKAELRARQQPCTGTKPELLRRLTEYVSRERRGL